MIRDAQFQDSEQLITLVAELVESKMSLRPNRDRIRKIVSTALTSNTYKLLVAVEDNVIKGLMLTISDAFDFAEKQYAYIRCIYATTPGISRRLVEITMDWIQTRKSIQMVCYAVPVKTGVNKLLLDFNFEDTGSMLVWRRYGDL